MAKPSTTMREAGTSSAARRPVRRPSLTHLLIGLAVALAFVFNLLALRDRSATALVAVADRSIAQGDFFDPADLRFVPIDADFEGIASLMTPADVSAVSGWVYGRPVAAGAIIEMGSVVEPGAPSGMRSMSIPIEADHAAGGAIRVGDRVDVISVEKGVAAFVVSDVGVVGLPDGANDAFGLSDYYVVVAVSGEQALAIAAAVDAGSIEVIRSTGAEPPAGGSG